jgi:hypothetical protein
MFVKVGNKYINPQHITCVYDNVQVEQWEYSENRYIKVSGIRIYLTSIEPGVSEGSIVAATIELAGDEAASFRTFLNSNSGNW